jgi:virulence-associated protein VapD
MYALVFDLDHTTLDQTYRNFQNSNPYVDIKKALEARGFHRHHANLYFADDKVNVISCILAVLDFAKENAWFVSSVLDIRMLFIDDNSDLLPLLKKPAA